MNFSKNLFFVFLIICSLNILVGCGGGDDEPTYAYAGWYNVYGVKCADTLAGYGPGCNYFYSNTITGGNLNKVTVEYSPYAPGRGYSFFQIYDTWNYRDSYGNPQTYTGWGWIDQGGVLFNEYNQALNATKPIGRDHIGDIAADAETMISQVAEEFSSRYDLPLETGRHVAYTFNDWALIGQTRARTSNDIATLSQKLYGIDVLRVKSAVSLAKDGDRAALEKVAEEAASNWGTTPETFKEIQETWFAREIRQSGF